MSSFNDETIFFSEYTNHLLAEGDSWYAWAHLNLHPSSNILEQLDFRDARPSLSVSRIRVMSFAT
jgi:hypothetical protein